LKNQQDKAGSSINLSVDVNIASNWFLQDTQVSEKFKLFRDRLLHLKHAVNIRGIPAKMGTDGEGILPRNIGNDFINLSKILTRAHLSMKKSEKTDVLSSLPGEWKCDDISFSPDKDGRKADKEKALFNVLCNAQTLYNYAETNDLFSKTKLAEFIKNNPENKQKIKILVQDLIRSYVQAYFDLYGSKLENKKKINYEKNPSLIATEIIALIMDEIYTGIVDAINPIDIQAPFKMFFKKIPFIGWAYWVGDVAYKTSKLVPVKKVTKKLEKIEELLGNVDIQSLLVEAL